MRRVITSGVTAFGVPRWRHPAVGCVHGASVSDRSGRSTESSPDSRRWLDCRLDIFNLAYGMVSGDIFRTARQSHQRPARLR